MGTEAQKQKYLATARAREKLSTFCSPSRLRQRRRRNQAFAEKKGDRTF